jgi:dihydroflavonol-4-reductase
MTGGSTLVAVTGATGFIASHLIAELLATGYRVRGTVRKLDRAAEHRHLTTLPGAAERLELVEADLLVPGSFDRAVQGVEAVFHTASPFVISVRDPQRDLVDPALQGTLNVLQAAAASPGVRRVVLTSSFVAVTDGPRTGYVFTEADWNTDSTLLRNTYSYSKTVAERAAWDFMAQAAPGFDLVAINPYLVVGPQLAPRLSGSNQILADILGGVYPGIIDIDFGIVDVRDVVRAHRLALETPGANGRYICAGDVLSMREIVAAMREAVPDARRLPTRSLDGRVGTVLARGAAYLRPVGERAFLRTHLGQRVQYDTSRIQRDLGMEFRPAPEALADAARYLVGLREGRAG